MLKHVFELDATTVIEALRIATRSRHAKLASSPAMLRLFDADYTVLEYRAHLGRLLGIFEPLENAAALVADPAGPVHLPHRASDLHEDLLMMGAVPAEISALERCRQLPPIATAGLRGYTYVVLGSLLGGRIIVKQLRAVLGPDASFRFYGEAMGYSEARWESFCSDLEENGRNDVETICATAVGIFDAYAAWVAEPPLQAGNH